MKKRFSWKFWVTIITAALIISVVIFSWQEILKAWGILSSGNINLLLFLLIIPIQITCYLGRAEIAFLYLRAKGESVSRRKMIRCAFEISFVDNVAVVNSIAGMTYFSWALLPNKVNSHNSVMSQIINYALTLVGSVILLVISAAFLLKFQLNAALVAILLATITICLVSGIVYIIRNQKRITTFSIFLANLINRLHRKFSKKENNLVNLALIESFFYGLRQNYLGIIADKKLLARPFFWAMIVAVLEPCLLWLIFASLGTFLSPAVAVVAFYLSYMLCIVSITPGGVGTQELGLATFLATAGGLSLDLAIAGTILASVTEVLIAISLGYFFYQNTINQYGKPPKNKNSAVG